jgi:hypothetical protein
MRHCVNGLEEREIRMLGNESCSEGGEGGFIYLPYPARWCD